jgi:ATP-binding cassette subfamily B protein
VARLNSTTDKILKLELKKVRYIRSLSFVQGTTVNALRTSILFLMLYLIYTQAITVGQFFSLFIYSFFIFGPLQELGNIINVYRETEVSLKNFADVLAMPVEPRPAQPGAAARPRAARLRRRQLHAPDGHDAGAHRHLVRVARGDTVAFVGPSGSGKTTLVKLLVGLYPPQTGDILYNGHPAATVDLDQLRKRIGFVTQDTQLFSGTIRENLLFVNPAATDAECLDVLRQAACDSLLARADKGLDTVIGEGGVKVSAARNSGCRSPARCCAGRTCWSSTRRRRRSTR